MHALSNLCTHVQASLKQSAPVAPATAGPAAAFTPLPPCFFKTAAAAAPGDHVAPAAAPKPSTAAPADNTLTKLFKCVSLLCDVRWRHLSCCLCRSRGGGSLPVMQ